MMSSCCKKLQLALMLLCMAVFSMAVSAFDFEVGGTDGWQVPHSNNSQFYNQWASKNRFQVGDAINFRYKKDSVMEVTEEEYSRCNSTQPIFFSNNGPTEIRLDHSGTFYFISGVHGHCELGQKMIVKVLGHPTAPTTSPGSAKQIDDTDASADHSNAADPVSLRTAALLMIGSILISYMS